MKNSTGKQVKSAPSALKRIYGPEIFKNSQELKVLGTGDLFY
jgi:hypothetical protein